MLVVVERDRLAPDLQVEHAGGVWAEFAADSSLEGDGFELPVPRAMQARLKAKIAGFACMRSLIIWGCRFRAR
jgi:hypothetical protein